MTLNRSNTDTQVFPELEVMEEQYSYIELANIDEAIKFIEHEGILNEGGVFLTDIDETLRPSITDKITRKGISNFDFARLNRIPQKSLDVIDKFKENDWHVGAVTNQPRSGHQIAKGLSQVLNYKEVMEELNEREVPVFGFKPSSKPYSIRNNPLTDSLKFYAQLVGEKVGKKTAFKSTPESAKEVVDDLISREMFEFPNIVYVGNNERDINFGKLLRNQLKESKYEGTFLMVKLPNLYTESEEA
ncbi:hypothetical protein ACFL0C_02030 [Patescibacteria group bacterium]